MLFNVLYCAIETTSERDRLALLHEVLLKGSAGDDAKGEPDKSILVQRVEWLVMLPTYLTLNLVEQTARLNPKEPVDSKVLEQIDII